MDNRGPTVLIEISAKDVYYLQEATAALNLPEESAEIITIELLCKRYHDTVRQQNHSTTHLLYALKEASTSKKCTCSEQSDTLCLSCQLATDLNEVAEDINYLGYKWLKK